MRREAKEETSLVLEPGAVLGVYSDPPRDPRMHTMTVTFITIILEGNEEANDDAAGIQWGNVEGELNTLMDRNQIAFDHLKIMSDLKNWRKIQGSTGRNNNIPTFWSTKERKASAQEVPQVKSSD